MFFKDFISKYFISLMLLPTSVLAIDSAAVSGIAKTFLFNQPIPHAEITVLETGFTMRTNQDGRFGPFYFPIGRSLTLLFEKFGYSSVQSGTFIVKKSGLTGPYKEISFQVPSWLTFYLYAHLIGATLDKDHCHVVSTITAYHKTLNDLPQGEPHARAILRPQNEQPFYFGIFKDGPFRYKTNPFTRQLIDTSQDGGIAFFNLPPQLKPYILTATKAGKAFTKTQFICRPGSFINISPPQGPAIKPDRSS